MLDGEDLQGSIRKMIEEFVASTVADGLGSEQHPDLAAVNEALRGVSEISSQRLNAATGGLNIPGLM